MVRSIKEWAEIIGNADATHCGDAIAAAVAIEACVSKRRQDKYIDMGNALQAYAYLLQQAGVTQTIY